MRAPRMILVTLSIALFGISPTVLHGQSPLSPEHERIDFLVGEWQTVSEFADGRSARGALSYEWVLGGAWMKVHFDGDHPDGGVWEAHGMQRWNPETEEYEAHVYAGSGPPVTYRGSSDGPGHFGVALTTDSGSSGIDYHRQDDGTVYQENWVIEGGERRITLRTRYHPASPP